MHFFIAYAMHALLSMHFLTGGRPLKSSILHIQHTWGTSISLKLTDTFKTSSCFSPGLRVQHNGQKMRHEILHMEISKPQVHQRDSHTLGVCCFSREHVTEHVVNLW